MHPGRLRRVAGHGRSALLSRSPAKRAQEAIEALVVGRLLLHHVAGEQPLRGAPDASTKRCAEPATALLRALQQPEAATQRREHERMRAMGERVEVVDSYERVYEVLA